MPTILLWRISKKLFEKEEYNESIKMIEKLSINNEDQLIFSIKAISKSYSEKFEQTILQSLNNSEDVIIRNCKI